MRLCVAINKGERDEGKAHTNTGSDDMKNARVI